MIIVHHLNNSRSQRVLWLLEELEVPYEVKRYERDPETMRAPATLREVHPLGKSPILTDDGVTLIETGAVMEYLVDRYDNGRLIPPAGSPERLLYTQWMHYAEGSVMPPLLLKLVFDRMEVSPAPFFVRPIIRKVARRAKASFVQPQIDLHLDYLESELKNRKWFAGDALTAADVQLSFPLEAAALRGELNKKRPNLTAFLKRIHARPAYQRALERGGAYDFAP